MRRFVIVAIISIVRIFSLYSEEFRIDYNEGTDQVYYLVFRILEDSPGTIEISKTGFYYDIELDEVVFPSHVIYNNYEYTVTTLDCAMGYGYGDVWF